MWSTAAPTATLVGLIRPLEPIDRAPSRHLGNNRMELADILSEESVLVCTDIATKHDVLLRLADKVASLTGHPATEVFQALNDRESLGSTGLGNGIAVPHGKYAPLKGVMAVFMKLAKPVDF